MCYSFTNFNANEFIAAAETAGAAGAIAMHAWVRRHVFGQHPG